MEWVKMPRTRTLVIAGAVVIVLVTGAGATVGLGGGLSGGLAGGLGGGSGTSSVASGTLPPATAKVVKGTLAQVEIVAGTLSYGIPVPLKARPGGGVLTWLPAGGALVKLGAPAYKVDNKPVVLIHGFVPPYRDLEIGTSGEDVKQLQKSLKALGYAGFSVTGHYGWTTAAAVGEWQEDIGVEQTGIVEFGQIFVAPGDIRVASPQAQLGDQIGSGSTVFTYSGAIREVTVALDVAKQQLVKKGTAATVTLPNDKVVSGTVSRIGTVASSTDSSGEVTNTLTVIVAVADQGALGALDSAPVNVSLVAATRSGVLSVPIAALLAKAEGGYAVQVVKGSSVAFVPVETGMFANGKVEISGAGIAEGTVVGVPK